MSIMQTFALYYRIGDTGLSARASGLRAGEPTARLVMMFTRQTDYGRVDDNYRIVGHRLSALFTCHRERNPGVHA